MPSRAPAGAAADWRPMGRALDLRGCALPFVAALPWMHARIAAVLDRRWLGRRFTTVEAVKQFLAALRSATTEAQLVEHAEQASRARSSERRPCQIHLEPETSAGARSRCCTRRRSSRAIAGVGRILWARAPARRRTSARTSRCSRRSPTCLASVLDNLHLQERKASRSSSRRSCRCTPAARS